MSKVKDFVANSPAKHLRSSAYLVKPAEKSKSDAIWSAGNVSASTTVSAAQVRVSCAGQKLSDQIRRVFSNHYRFIGKIPARKTLDRQVKLMCVHYEDLQELGFEIKDVTTFSQRHALALLFKWQSAQCAPNTVYVRWSCLRTWSRVLGKHGMLAQLKDVQPGFNRCSGLGGGTRTLDSQRIADRSNYLKSKSDLTVYLVDRLCRELDMTREYALQIELDAVKAVIEDDTAILRVGQGAHQKNVPIAQHNHQLLGEARDFMVSRNRKVLAWSHLDLDAALQKYTLRLSYVSRTLFSTDKKTDASGITEGSAA